MRNYNFLTFPYHLFQKAHEEEAGNFDADAILSFDVLKQGLNLGNGDFGVGYSYENQLDVVPGNDLRNIMYDHNVYTNYRLFQLTFKPSKTWTHYLIAAWRIQR